MRVFSALAMFCLVVTSLPAQSIYGTLTGIVSDPSQAVVAAAKIKLVNAESRDNREIVTNSDGYYTFVSVPPGAYEITVSESVTWRKILSHGTANCSKGLGR